jgi:quinol monooxygenase YgiN
MQIMPDDNKRVFTVTWTVREGEVEKARDIIARFAPLARTEPGLELLAVHQAADRPDQFLFYEVFTNEEAFAVHQEMPHFKDLILQQALPLLTKRERIRYALI